MDHLQLRARPSLCPFGLAPVTLRRPISLACFASGRRQIHGVSSSVQCKSRTSGDDGRTSDSRFLPAVTEVPAGAQLFKRPTLQSRALSSTILDDV